MNPGSWESVLGKEGLAELASAYGPRLTGFFRSLGADSRSAEDLTQELFLKLMKTQAQYEERGQIQAYLFRMAHRLWIDESRVRRPRIVGEPSEEDWLRRREPEPGPFELCLREDEKQKLLDAVASLPEPQRIVFEMGVLRGLRYREIAETLGIPVGTVKTRVFAAAKRIRALLSREDGSPAQESIEP